MIFYLNGIIVLYLSLLASYSFCVPIQFRSTGHTGTLPSPRSVRTPGSIQLPLQGNLRRTGLVFLGWRTADGTIIPPGATIIFSTEAVGTLALDAHWVNWVWDAGRNVNTNLLYTRVGFWPGQINVYSSVLGPSNPNFPFYETMGIGINAWSDALGVPINTTTNQQNAQLLSFGGEREYLIHFSGRTNIGPNVAGFAEHPPMTAMQQLVIGNSTKTVYRHSGYSRLFNFERPRGNNLTQLIKHEIGHSLGYWGHSTNENSVMWFSLNNNPTLQSGERIHLRQVYQHFR